MMDTESISSVKTAEFILVYRRMCLRERKRRRRDFRVGGKPWSQMCEAAHNCYVADIRPERYIGIVIWHRARKLGRRSMPSPRVLASQEMLQVVETFLERCRRQKPTANSAFDLESNLRPSTVRMQVDPKEDEK